MIPTLPTLAKPAGLLASVLLALPVLADTIPVDSTPTDGGEQWRFDVYLDDRPIGYHAFRATEDATGLRLDSEADFEVKFLFVTAFDYEHRNTEIWRDGCLQQIDATTRANGKRFAVTGVERDGQFDLVTQDGDARLNDCVRSFAYWDRSLLGDRRLLNSQTGEYLDVTIEPTVAGTVQIGDREIAVERFSLSAKGMDITLAYAADGGQWLALDSTVKGGRTLRYRRDPNDIRPGSGLAAGAAAAAPSALK